MAVRLLFLSKCLFFLFAHSLQAQHIDSLEQRLQSNELLPGEQLKIYDELSWAYFGKASEKAMAYAREGVSLSSQEKDTKMKAALSRKQGVAYDMCNKLVTAAVYK